MRERQPATIEEYLDTQPPESAAALTRVRAVLHRALPAAEETISYQMPAIRLNGRIVLYFAGWKDHVSIYPITDALRDTMSAEIAPYVAGKGTLRFPLVRRLPVRLIERIARVRAAEVAAAATAAAARRREARKRA